MKKNVIGITKTKKCEKEVVYIVRALGNVYEVFANREDAEKKYNSKDYDIEVWSVD